MLCCTVHSACLRSWHFKQVQSVPQAAAFSPGPISVHACVGAHSVSYWSKLPWEDGLDKECDSSLVWHLVRLNGALRHSVGSWRNMKSQAPPKSADKPENKNSEHSAPYSPNTAVFLHKFYSLTSGCSASWEAPPATFLLLFNFSCCPQDDSTPILL